MIRSLILSFLFSIPCFCQTTTTPSARTSGPCSPAVAGNNNRFTIECEGISKEQEDQVLELLNRIASRQLDPKALVDKLDDLRKYVQAETDRMILALTGRLPQHFERNATENLTPSADVVTTTSGPQPQPLR